MGKRRGAELALLLLVSGCGDKPAVPPARQFANTAAANDVAADDVPASDPEALSNLQGLGVTGDWRVVTSQNRNGIIDATLFDHHSVVIRPDGIRQIWRAEIHADNGDTYYTLSQVAFDCRMRTSSALQYITRNERGASTSPGSGKPSAAIPGTVGEAWLEAACDDEFAAKAERVPKRIDPVTFVRRGSLGVLTTDEALSEQDFGRLLTNLRAGRPFRIEASVASELQDAFRDVARTGRPGILDTFTERKLLAQRIRARVAAAQTRKAMIAFIS